MTGWPVLNGNDNDSRLYLELFAEFFAARPWRWGLVHIAPVAPAQRQVFQPFSAEDFSKRLVHTSGHALEAAADVDGGTFIDPLTHADPGFQQAILNIAALGLVAREHGVEPCQQARALPSADFLAIVVIAVRVTLAEDQPVGAGAAGSAGFQMTAQAGDTAAVADQDQRPLGIGAEAKARMPTQSQWHAVADVHLLCQPVGGGAE